MNDLYFFGKSQTGTIAKSVNWSSSPLGEPENWPDDLKVILGMLYGNRQPVCLFWGSDLTYFYNDGYIPIVGASKHPWAMGRPGKEVWNEIWDFLLPQINQVLLQGEATWNEDQYLPILGNDGRPRDAFFTYSYSPVYLTSGKINGVLVTCTETTARIIAEKKLRESQQSLKLALSSAKMGSWEVNLTTSKVTLSDETKNIFGFSKEYKNSDLAIDDFIHPDDRDHARQVLRNAVASGKPYDDTYRIIRPDGEVRWINSKGQARYDNNNKPVLLVGLTFDITEKKISEEALKASELKFKQIGEALPQLVWTSRPDGSCDYLSRQWIEYTGMSESEQLGLKWLEKVVHPEDRQKTAEHWEGAVKGLHPYDMEYRIRRFDGVYRWFKVRGTPFKNNQGEITYWFGTCTDIQDAKEAQLNYEKNVDTSPAMLWITEKDGYCSYLSKQWYENTGQTPATGLGFGWLDMTHPDDMERAEKTFREATEKRKPFYAEYRLRQKNGEYHWSIDAGNPRLDSNGEFNGFAGTVIDIHDRKIAELNTAEALRARDEFLSIASHELKTPLTTLKLQSDLHKRKLSKGAVESIQGSYEAFLQLTDKQVLRLSRLVDDMLDVARIRTGKLTFEYEKVDLCEVMNDVIQRLSTQFSASSYALPNVPKCANGTGEWDRMRVEQVINNLLTNAIKYGNKKPIEVSIQSDDGHVSLTVKDQGIGISKTDQTKIFDRFERALNAKDISGLGLGLYITKQIVTALHGEISVESQLGVGSTFKVKLPKHRPEVSLS